jgi:hypothetical protein
VPFDPKLIRAEDAPLNPVGEIELPDDLAELAAQLGDDAVFLAERYPANRRMAEKFALPLVQPAHSSRRRVWIAASALGLLVTGALTALLSLGDRGDRTPIAETAAKPAPSPVSVVTLPELTNPVAEPVRELPLVRPPAATPAMFLNGVSGPELEGLLDLWEKDGQQDSRISI